MTGRILLGALTISFAWGRFADAESWPTYLGNNARVGYSTETVDAELHLQWSYQAPARPDSAWEGPRAEPIEGHVMLHRVDFDAALQVVMDSGRAYFGSSVDHRVYCVEAATGEVRWSFYTEGPVRLAPTLAQGNVYFGSDDGRVYCLNAENGELIWQFRVGPTDDRLLARGEMISRWPVRTGVLVDGGVAYFGAGIFPHEMVYLCAVKADDGALLWRNDSISEQNAGRNDLSPQGYLLCSEDKLFVPSGRSLPVAVSRETGEIVHQRSHAWRTDAGGVVGGTKALLGDGQVYAGGPHHFLAMDQETGEEGEAWIDGRQMVLADGEAILVNGASLFCVDRRIHADASKEKQKWFLTAREVRKDPVKLGEAQAQMKRFAAIGIKWQHPTTADGALVATRNLVFVGGQDSFSAVDRATGKSVWEFDVEGTVRGISVSDGFVTASTDAGRIYCFSHQKVDTPKAWPKAHTEPAFPDDELSAFYRQTAATILERSEQRKGFCLVLGSADGRLAYELAQQSELTVYGVEPDADRANASRRALERVGLHGTRVHIVNAAFDALPFSNYFANLVTSDSFLLDGKLPGDARFLTRHLKPCGGVVTLGLPEGSPAKSHRAIDEEVKAWFAEFRWDQEGESTADVDWETFRRGKLAGAGDWSHQYGNVANTSYTVDKRIKDGLGVLWYGDPGPSAMINRHEAAAAPLSTNGRMFIQGTDKVMCYDAYNGTFLWELENPGAIRTGVFNNRETSNLAASDDALYVAIHDRCMALDAETGQELHEFRIPGAADGVPRAWAYVAYDDGMVFGTSTVREELERHLRRRGLTVKSRTDAIFAVDAKTGERLWSYRGDNILHTTIAIGPERMYFIDSSLSPDERQRLYSQDKTELKKLTGEEAKQAEEEMKARDLRLCVAIDKRTGEKVWEQPVDVTDTTNVSAGGGNLTVMVADDYLVLCGANANGHYWKQFLAGEFDRRKLLVLKAKTGEKVWSKNANYMNRPAVIGNQIFAEPWAFDLATGTPKKRPHPLTGKESDWRFSRPGHHCGVITATPNMMFFRSGFIGYYDLYNDSGTRHFAGQRLGCWVNAIPGNGLVMIPEASAGCVCLFSIASTVVMEPKAESKSWGIFSAVGPATPVRRIGINLGAPGDRKDVRGNEWFGYPRPSTRGRLEFELDLKPKLVDGGGWYSQNAESLEVTETDVPWIFTSGARGLSRLEIPLLAEGDAAATYDVRLYFADLPGQPTGSCRVTIQGHVTPDDLPGTEAAFPGQAKIAEFRGITVEKDLVLELEPVSETLPTLSGVEVIRME